MNSRLRRLLAATGLVIAGAVLAACSSVSSPAVTGTVTETGSTLMLPLLSSWQVAYEQANPHISVITAGTGSGTGILDAATGLVSVGGSDTFLPASVPAVGLENIPLTVAGLTVDYNLPGVHQALHLDGKVLARIYSGKITRWDDPQLRALNPGVTLPALHIVTVHRSDSSGSTNLLTTYLNAQASFAWPAASVGTALTAWPATRGGQVAEKGSSAVLAGCKAHKGCLAYLGVSYLTQLHADHLGVAALANASKQYVMPTRESMRQALARAAPGTPATGTQQMVNGKAGYPIINYEYAVVRTAQPSAAQAAVLRHFLRWAITTGSTGQYLSGVGFVPLPANVQAISQHLITKIR